MAGLEAAHKPLFSLLKIARQPPPNFVTRRSFTFWAMLPTGRPLNLRLSSVQKKLEVQFVLFNFQHRTLLPGRVVVLWPPHHALVLRSHFHSITRHVLAFTSALAPDILVPNAGGAWRRGPLVDIQGAHLCSNPVDQMTHTLSDLGCPRNTSAHATCFFLSLADRGRLAHGRVHSQRPILGQHCALPLFCSGDEAAVRIHRSTIENYASETRIDTKS